MSQWTLFSNHGHVLLFLANDPEARLRDVATAVGITERAVQKIVRDLQDGNVLSVQKRGRRNRYRINTRKSLRHPLEAHRTIGSLIKLICDKPDSAAKAAAEIPAKSDKLPERAVPVAPVTTEKPSQRTVVATPPAGTMPVPKAVEQPGPEPRPESVPKPVDRPQPGPEAIPQPVEPPSVKPEKVREIVAETAKTPAKKKARKKATTDEQQGSLF